MDDNQQAIMNFLNDIDCLTPLDNWRNPVNVFDILKIDMIEIRHSNILAWLLNPHENHGVEATVLKKLIRYGISIEKGKYWKNTPCLADILLMNCQQFLIFREWKNIDILAVSEQEKCVICIENKRFTGEHDDQLNRYRGIIEEKYKDYKKLYVFLTPQGVPASDEENWCPLSYRTIKEWLECLLQECDIESDAKLVVINYVNEIRRNFMGEKYDADLVKLCRDIYARHQKAFNLIYDVIPNRTAYMTSIFREWAYNKSSEHDSELIFSANNCDDVFTRFTTKKMSQILPDDPKHFSSWKTHNYYFYEVLCEGRAGKPDTFKIQLVFNIKANDKDIPHDLLDKMNQIAKLDFPNADGYEDFNNSKKDYWGIDFPVSKIGEYIKGEEICARLDEIFTSILNFEEVVIKTLNRTS